MAQQEHYASHQCWRAQHTEICEAELCGRPGTPPTCHHHQVSRRMGIIPVRGNTLAFLGGTEPSLRYLWWVWMLLMHLWFPKATHGVEEGEQPHQKMFLISAQSSYNCYYTEAGAVHKGYSLSHMTFLNRDLKPYRLYGFKQFNKMYKYFYPFFFPQISNTKLNWSKVGHALKLLEIIH